MKSKSETVAKDILLDELNEQGHPVMVEDVIFWALEHYAEAKKGTWGCTVAYAIVERIKREEKETEDRERWSRFSEE